MVSWQSWITRDYCRSRHRQVLADDLKDFCEDPTSPETCLPSRKQLRGEKASGRLPAV
jgi:DNA-directed RNA polymerase specialized sigma24 family protein